MALHLTASGVGLSANVTAVASIGSQLSFKFEMLSDGINAISSFGAMGLFAIDSDGAGTNKKIESFVSMDGSGNFGVTVNAPGQGNNNPTKVSRSTNIPANGTVIVVYGSWDSSAGDVNATVYSTSGTALATFDRSSFFGGALSTTGGANGRITLNSSFTGGQTQATSYGGFAIYNVPLVGSAQYSAPATGDANIVYLSKMNDAFSGTSPSTAAAQVGTQGLVLTGGQFNWASSGSTWFGPAAVPPPHAVNSRATFAARHRSFYY